MSLLAASTISLFYSLPFALLFGSPTLTLVLVLFLPTVVQCADWLQGRGEGRYRQLLLLFLLFAACGATRIGGFGILALALVGFTSLQLLFDRALARRAGELLALALLALAVISPLFLTPATLPPPLTAALNRHIPSTGDMLAGLLPPVARDLLTSPRIRAYWEPLSLPGFLAETATHRARARWKVPGARQAMIVLSGVWAVPGSGPNVPPDTRPGWRWTSEGQWLNDISGEYFADGRFLQPPRPAPGSGPTAPPDDQPGWRWTSDGAWLNDITGATWRGAAHPA